MTATYHIIHTNTAKVAMRDGIQTAIDMFLRNRRRSLNLVTGSVSSAKNWTVRGQVRASRYDERIEDVIERLRYAKRYVVDITMAIEEDHVKLTIEGDGLETFEDTFRYAWDRENATDIVWIHLSDYMEDNFRI